MSETYDEIINEIEQLDRCGNYNRYLLNHGIERVHKWWCSDMALDIARRVRESVGGDPSEWWVKCHGEKLRIEDEIKPYADDSIGEVVALGKSRVIFDDGGELDSRSSKYVRKIIPDTREKIIEDTLAKLDQTRMYRTSLVTESVEQAVDRAMKLRAGQ